MVEEKSVTKSLRIKVIRPLLNEDGEIRLRQLKEKSEQGHVPSNHQFWSEIKKDYPEVVTWNELGGLLTQIQKKICFIYNKASANIYSELSRIDFKIKNIDSILSRFGYPEAMKELHDSYFALGVRQKLQGNFSGEKLKELRRATISLPVARSDIFPIPVTMQNGFKIEEINDKSYSNYGDFVMTIPFPRFEPKKEMDDESKDKIKKLKDKLKLEEDYEKKFEINNEIENIENNFLNKYKPWEKYDFQEGGSKKNIRLLLSTKERKKIDKSTQIKIKNLKEEIKKEKDAGGLKFLRDKLSNLQENLDFGTQAEIKRVVKGEYKITWVEINRGKKLGDKNKWFVHLSIKVPIRELELNKEIVGGIDIGCNSPVYCAVNNSFRRLNIQGHDVMFFNKKSIARRRTLLKGNRYKRSGHGSKNKLEPITILTEKNELFRKKIMERWVKEVVNFFVKNQAGIVQMENLESMNSRADTFFNEKLRTTWPYAKLQNMISNKLKEQGIEVREVKSKFTSQICSACGHWNNYFTGEYRRDNKFPLFKCKNCEIELSSDYNAAKNIANPNIEKRIEEIEKLINKESSGRDNKKVVKKQH